MTGIRRKARDIMRAARDFPQCCKESAPRPSRGSVPGAASRPIERDVGAQRVEFAVGVWYQCAPMTDRARFYFWYYAFPKPLAEEGSRSV